MIDMAPRYAISRYLQQVNPSISLVASRTKYPIAPESLLKNNTDVIFCTDVRKVPLLCNSMTKSVRLRSYAPLPGSKHEHIYLKHFSCCWLFLFFLQALFFFLSGFKSRHSFKRLLAPFCMSLNLALLIFCKLLQTFQWHSIQRSNL